MMNRLTVAQAAETLAAGQLVLFPTETSYGLGCAALNHDAVARLVQSKGRPTGKPLPILLPEASWLSDHQIETPLMILARAFWPGPLTLIVPAFPGLPMPITAGTNMVGVRISAHPMALELVARLGEPVVATSANRTGQPAACSVAECDATGLPGIAGLVEGETLPGQASTVVGLVDGDLHFFRHGALSEANLRAVWESERNAN